MAVRRIKGSWWVDIRFRKRRYRLRSPADYREGAAEYERHIIARLMAGDAVYASQDKRCQWDQQFAGFSAQWFETYVKANLELSTQKEYAGVIRRALVPAFGKQRLDAIGSFEIERFKADRRKAGVSPKTINNDLFVLSKLLRTAAEWGVFRSAPRIRYLPQDPLETDFLTASECKSLLEKTWNPKWRLFFFVALRTGLRAGELIALRWEDIDLDTRIVTVRRNIVDGVVKHPKRKRIRFVTLPWDLHAVFEAIRRPAGYVFTQFGDEPLTRSMAYNALQRARKKARLRQIGLHTLRHSYSAHFMMGAKDIYSLQRLLGHANVTTTQRYAHLAPDYLRSVVDLVPGTDGELARLTGHSVGNPWAPDGEQKGNTP